MFRFYCIKNCYWATIEANAIVNIRIGFTCFGFGTKKKMLNRYKRKWYNPLPIFLVINAHTGQSGMVRVFDVGCKLLHLSYTTKGDATTPAHHRWKERGLHLQVLKWGR